MAKLDYKPAENVALAGIFVQLIAGLAALIFAGVSGAGAVLVLAWEGLLAVPVWLMALAYLRQSRLAEEERVEWERLQAERAAGGARGELFEVDEIQAFAARNRLRFLERFMGRMLSVLLVLGVAGLLAFALINGVRGEDGVNTERALLSGVLILALTFVQFLIANYAAGMSRQAAWRPLRAAANFMMLSALFGAAATVGLFLAHGGFGKPDLYMAWVMIGIMGVLGLEITINFVLDFYRPHVEGVEVRPSYDSRLLGLMSEPGGILRTVASTLDYQFGFKISQTWFYQLLEQMVAPVLLILIVTLYLLTSFVIVDVDERGVLERFGEFKKVVTPGVTVKWPWPIDRVVRFPANEVKTFALGHEGEAVSGDTILWTEMHYETEYLTMVATDVTGDEAEGRQAPGIEGEAVEEETEPAIPVSLLVASLTVRYQINDTDEALKQWYYDFSAPEVLLEGLCSRVQQQYFASVDFDRVFGPDRGKAGQELRERMQQSAEDVGLPVTILSVGLEEVHPPVEGTDLPRFFHERVLALTESDIAILEARTEAVKTKAQARIDESRFQYEAQSFYMDKVNNAKAWAKMFNAQAKVYQDPDAFEVSRAVRLLDLLSDEFAGVRKLVIAVAGVDKDHLRLNLEDPASAGLADIEFDTEKDAREAAEEAANE